MEVSVKSLFTFMILAMTAVTAHAGDLKWEGTYRFEGLKVFNPSLADGGNNKAYMLHHMTLRPQIQAFDGLTIHSRFDIFNSAGNNAFPNDQLGSTFGQGLNNPPPEGNGVGNSNTIGDQQSSGTININELYGN